MNNRLVWLGLGGLIFYLFSRKSKPSPSAQNQSTPKPTNDITKDSTQMNLYYCDKLKIRISNVENKIILYKKAIEQLKIDMEKGLASMPPPNLDPNVLLPIAEKELVDMQSALSSGDCMKYMTKGEAMTNFLGLKGIKYK